jgi:glycolate oxidase iron-sulfur subunit
VPYGRLIEAARAEIEAKIRRPLHVRLLRSFIFRRVLPSRAWMKTLGALLYLYQASGLRAIAEGSGFLRLFGKLGRVAPLAPAAEVPFFFDHIGETYPADGERRFRVALLAGCIANVFFARLNEATVRVLQKNGCEVVIPGDQTCCGALHAHAGERRSCEGAGRKNIDALLPGDFDAHPVRTPRGAVRH